MNQKNQKFNLRLDNILNQLNLKIEKLNQKVTNQDQSIKIASQIQNVGKKKLVLKKEGKPSLLQTEKLFKKENRL